MSMRLPGDLTSEQEAAISLLKHATLAAYAASEKFLAMSTDDLLAVLKSFWRLEALKVTAHYKHHGHD